MGILCAVIFFLFFFFFFGLCIFFFLTAEMAEMESVEGWTCSALYFCFRPYVTVLKRESVYFKMRSEGHQDLRLTTSHTHTLYTPHTYTRARAQPIHFNTRQRLCCDYGPHAYCHQRALPPPPTRCEHVVCCHQPRAYCHQKALPPPPTH
jgi:hypothetical protein